MNLLAHAVLSPDSPHILVGNLTADWIKGRARLSLPREIQQGFHLHRRIDAFTDVHPLVELAAALLEPRWGRYSPVLIDIFLDHFLSVHWPHETPRPAFIQNVYAILRDHLDLLPPRARMAVSYLLADDWFSCYATFDGLALTLTRLSARLGHAIELAPAVNDLCTHYTRFDALYRQFFPLLEAHVREPAACPD